MSEAEAIEYLGLTVRTLQRYRKKGTLAYQEVRGKTRPTVEYDPAELERLKQQLENKRRRAAKSKPAAIAITQRVTFGLSQAGYEELVKEAEHYGLRPSDYARRLVREKLESQFQATSEELRGEVKRLTKEVARLRKNFAAGLEAILEFQGLTPEEAREWVNRNLR